MRDERWFCANVKKSCCCRWFPWTITEKQVMTRLQSEMRSIGMMRGSLKYFQYTPEVRSSLNEPVRTSTLNLFDSDVKHIDRSGPGLTSLARQWWCANTTIESIFSLYSERYGINKNPRKKKVEWVEEFHSFVIISSIKVSVEWELFQCFGAV